MEEAANMEQKLKEEREDELIAQTPKTDTNLYNLIKAIKRAKPKVGPLFNQAGTLCFKNMKN